MIIVLGDNSSGKTSFIQRYIKGPSKQIKTKKTVAFKCEKKCVTFSINNVIHKINIQLQDNPINSERIKELDISYVSQSDSIILVVDLDVEKKDTINNLDIWHDLLCTYNKKNVPVFLLPTKVDLLDEKQIIALNNILTEKCKKYNWAKLENICCLDNNKDIVDSNMRKVIETTIRNNEMKSDKVPYKSENVKSKKGICS